MRLRRLVVAPGASVDRRYNDVMASDAAPRRVTVRRLDEAAARVQPYRVQGTPAELLALVWPLTLEVCSLAPGFDAQSRLPRSVVRVVPPRR